MKISKAVGIDLGTTNSVIAMIGRDNTEIVCRTDRSGRKTFPSVVAFDKKSDSLQAGAPAFAKRGTAADPIVSIKSHMGDSAFRASTGPVTLSPVEVASVILCEMKQQMQDYLAANGYEDHLVDRAVITIPAYFTSNAREATTKAAEEAGLKVAFTLQEPTAAVLFYAQKHGVEDGIFLVYDLGGGTLDVSVVKVEGGDVIVLGIAGNNYLGGDNFDDALARFLLDEITNDIETGYDLEGFDPINDPDDRRRLIRLCLVAESIKKSLSLKDIHYEEFSNIFVDKAGAAVNLAMEITRTQFEDLIRPILDTTIDEVYQALDKVREDYQITLDMVDAVLLVGGSTHIPLVSEVIIERFTDPSLPQHTKQPVPLKYEPDMAVGYGAAIAAAGTGTSVLNEAARAILTGDPGAVASVARDALVITTTFRPGSGYAGESVVKGTLSVLRGSLPGPVTAVVTRASGGFRKEYPVDIDGTFVFTGLPVSGDPEPYSCEFVSGRSTIETATFDAAIRNAPEASVALSRTYFIETIGADGATKFVQLMRQGEALPLTREFEFATNEDNAYFAELRFFEERDFLKQVTITFAKPVAPLTPVKLSLSCNLQSRFSARAEVEGVVTETQFEPSPPPPMPNKEDIDKAVKQARAKAQQIPEAGKRLKTVHRIDHKATELEAAAAAGDAGKARDKLNELGKLADSVDVTKELAPSPEEFERLREKCEQANAESAKGGPQVATEIQAAVNCGRQAYATEDQAKLSQAESDLTKILQLLQETGPQTQPPVWLVVLMVAQEVLDYIDTVENRTDLPQAFRREQLSTADTDRSALRQAIRACTPPMPIQFAPKEWMSDEDAAPHVMVLQKLYPKWEKLATMKGTVKG